MDTGFDRKLVIEAKESFREQFSGKIAGAIILGSGISETISGFQTLLEFELGKIRNLKLSSVDGHQNKIRIVRHKNINIVMLMGRIHLYEGYSAFDTALPVAMLGEAGVENILLTNAAGGINSSFHPGDVMAITDHINFQGNNPLFGIKDPSKFIDMTDVYDPVLTRKVVRHFKLRQGIYAGVLGPNYETPAEIDFLKRSGADAVGMSTIMEVIMARYYHMNILGMSVITNKAAGLSKFGLSHEEVLESGKNARIKVSGIIEFIMDQWSIN